MLSIRSSHAAVLLSALAAAGCNGKGSTTTTGTGSTGSGSNECLPGAGCPTVKSDCIGLVDNSTAATYALRMSHVTVNKPTALATVTTKTLLDNGVAIDLPKCMSLSGDPFFPNPPDLGTFSWILQFDSKAGMLTTGGAKPQTDPTVGYCFVNETIQGFAIKPLVVSAPVGADGKFSIAMPEDVVVPVYSDATATTVILLPLRQVSLHDVTLSSDHNCIGKLNPNLDPNNLCLPDMMNPTFIDDGSLDGFVSLEDADKVAISQLGGESLCALLTGNCAMYCDTTMKLCKRDASNAIVFQGDWCMATNQAATATCHDAVQLSGTFAASSVAMKATCP